MKIGLYTTESIELKLLDCEIFVVQDIATLHYLASDLSAIIIVSDNIVDINTIINGFKLPIALMCKDLYKFNYIKVDCIVETEKELYNWIKRLESRFKINSLLNEKKQNYRIMRSLVLC